ncbi:MAG: hypothetical protein M0P31_13605 [Solirubrobacteraceae bacterium]|nr:hypothetical protein [Solirubrobacteraceae bacterium]
MQATVPPIQRDPRRVAAIIATAHAIRATIPTGPTNDEHLAQAADHIVAAVIRELRVHRRYRVTASPDGTPRSAIVLAHDVDDPRAARRAAINAHVEYADHPNAEIRVQCAYRARYERVHIDPTTDTIPINAMVLDAA